MFAIAGLSAGGAWASYQGGHHKALTVIATLISAVAFAAACFWMIGAME
ncbi:membrane protein [Corynebacterium aquilae DSM 44791]|uniref:Membrane protein n=1 Tax=Corynebacterium aquilae DSM 44791 TaxID=1431546 RepID=A0A1L7CGT6_9CORY|nr:membrane protein [Corynebacterium aquilae DSM 44791]